MGAYKKYAVLADVHGNSWALKVVLEDIQKRGIVDILNLGDVFLGPLDTAGTFDLITKNNMVTIAGNVDRYMLEVTLNKSDTPSVSLENPTMKYAIESLGNEGIAWLNKLTKFKIVDNLIFLCHGNLTNDDLTLVEIIKENGVEIKSDEELKAELRSVPQKIILCAHTHVGRFTNISDCKTIINPGSVGLPSYTSDTPYNHKMQSLSPHTKYCTIEIENDILISVEHICLRYDWDSAIQFAKKNNRLDWAAWLQTGRA